ncbi:MAG: hypothetical protein FWF37_03570 [Chloroflexi bacterium]|nr:hypothetical protein [Chloroflexota bacterium]
MPICKRCRSERVVKSGIVAGKQRYYCKDCGCNFREGDNRINYKIAAGKALCILFYAMTGSCHQTIARLMDIDHTLVYRWTRTLCANFSESKKIGEIKQIKFDEIVRYINDKKNNFNSSEPLTVACGELWSGCSAFIILQNSDASAMQ